VGTYTIREGPCRFGQPQMNNAKLHPKIGTAFRFIALRILSFPCQHLSGFEIIKHRPGARE